jgi:hypothetical protein
MLFVYKDMFGRDCFNANTIELTEELVKHIWSGTNQEKFIHVKHWIKEMSEKNGIIVPHVRLLEGNLGDRMYEITGGGEYLPEFNTIVLYKKISLVTLLHEFAHHMEAYVGKAPDEEFARGWSVSLFYIVAPDRYARAVENGTLKFI